MNLFSKKECLSCQAKDVVILQLQKKSTESCPACKNWTDHVAYLQNEIRILREDWKNERDEYKRAIDRLLEQHRVPAVGQGQGGNAQPMSIKDMMGIFEESKE